MKVEKKSNTRVQFTFDSDEQRAKLAKAVSYKVPGHQHSASFKTKLWDGTKCFLTATNTLSLGLFKSLFMEHALVCDSGHVPLTFDDIPLYVRLPEVERRQYQLDAINAIFYHQRGIINASMGSGKTLISAASCSYHLSLNQKHKVLFICYDKNILEQTIKTFTKYGFNVSQFGDGTKDLTGDIVVATIQSLAKIQKPITVLKNISFVITDESHHAKAKSSKAVLTKLINCKYYIGLTATPHMPKTLELAELISVIGPIIFQYGYSSAVEDEKITPVKAFFLDGPVDLDVKSQVFDRKNYKFIWDTAIQYNEYRNNMLASIISSLVDVLDTSNLVLVDRVEHGTALIKKLSTYKNIKSIAMYGNDDIVMRNNKKSRLMEENVNTLVSTVVTEGVDFKISPVVAVNASGRKSFIKLIQFLGRVTRPNEKFKKFRVLIDSIDNYNPSLRAHSNERIKACENFGLTVVTCKSVQELLIEIVKYYKECNK
ncbi:MAG: DEAD/DEAH box helicase family protein [Ignisphaera sp.]|nr:DEAD/DEAH box helicase family protein [Ignisphaera sp.]